MTLGNVLRVCVVGAGPGGLYTTKYLLKQLPQVKVDVIESLPTPYGLVRFGVAPDHQEVKSVQNDFNSVMNDDRVAFFGNVQVGKDIGVSDLRSRYNAVVLAYGASSDNVLGIPGENESSNVFAARRFVNWYNGHPDYAEAPDFSGETAIVVGQGNVAVDCARILTKSLDSLAATDISTRALDALSRSNIKRVQVVGRRGHVQAAFTIKELRELSKLDGVGCVVRKEELDLGATEASLAELESQRPKKRISDLLYKIADGAAEASKAAKQIELRFLLSPKEVRAGSDNAVSSLVLERTKLVGDPWAQSSKGTGELFEEPCSLLLRSIGYKSVALPGVPFDEKSNTAAAVRGRVNDSDPVDGLGAMYAAGWVKRGPTGIIGTNITDAKETVSSILADVESGRLALQEDGSTDLPGLLKERNCNFIDWNEYKRIEAFETSKGESSQPAKPREKLVDREEMLVVAKE